MRHRRVYSISIASTLLATAALGCGVSSNYFSALADVQLSTGSGSGVSGTSTKGSPNGSPCTPQQATNLRIIFEVDDSGSTDTDDPGAKVRGTSAVNFLNQNISDSGLTYAFGYFAALEPFWDFSSSSFVNTPTNPFGVASAALGAVNDFISIAPNVQRNGTSYTAAFQAVQALVTGDEATNPGNSYAVIFMSDGQPTRDATTNTAIGQLVTSLMTAAGTGRLTVSSLYFSNSPNSTEATIMSNIATVGLGQYVSANSSSLNLSSLIQNLIVVPITACQAS